MQITLSRNAIEQYMRCPRCFYLQRKLGVQPPFSFPLTLANATDALLKREFDRVRETGDVHPLWVREGLNVVAFKHPEIEAWRNNRKGIRVTHEATGAEIFGAVDDLWANLDCGDLHVVDYKSTSKQGTPSLDTPWASSYKRQLEMYSWMFTQAGWDVNPLAYILYVNGSKTSAFYNSEGLGLMEFTTTLCTHKCNISWVSDMITRAVECLESAELPNLSESCDNCRYFNERARYTIVTK